MRILVGVIAGAVVAVLCIGGLEILGHQIYPPPADWEKASRAEMAEMIAQLPMGAFALVVGAWFFGALIGGWVGNAIAKRGVAGWIVALMVMAASIATVVMFPQPAWMWAAAILVPLVAGWLAQRLAKVPT